jgi:hypothetical protein
MAQTSKLWISKGIEIKSTDEITAENLADYILNLKMDDITYEFIMETFGEFNGKAKCRSYDLLEVPAGKFSYQDFDKKDKVNKNKFTTTIGRWIFNIMLENFHFCKFFNGYWNETLNSKNYFGKVEKALSYALIEDEITTEDLKQWENLVQWMMPFEDIMSPNHTEKQITCTKAMNKKKAELLKKYKPLLDAGDPKAAEDMEKELLAYAKEYLKDDPYMDTVDSGAGGKFENNFKNMYLMKGAVMNPDPNAKQKYSVITSSYMDGVTAEEYSVIAGAGAAGAYSRGKKTETGGYWEKLFVAAYQHIKLDPKGSDCHTDKYITVNLDKDNIDDYMYCYAIRPNGSLELIDSKTRNKYIGKKTKLRFASMCKSTTGICNMCAGNLLYVGAENIGATMAQIPDVLKNKCMKAFHDSTVSTTEFDAMKAFFPFQ